jgi:hypothetical protein
VDTSYHTPLNPQEGNFVRLHFEEQWEGFFCFTVSFRQACVTPSESCC